METVTITSRAGRVWKFACAIWMGTTIALAILFFARAAMLGHRPELWEWWFFGAAPPVLAIAWLLYVWLSSANSARRLTADATGVTIERPDGKLVVLRWEEICRLGLSSDDDDVFVLRTHDQRHSV